MNVAIIGITGYAGMVLFGLLQKHPGIIKINIYQHDIKEAVPLKTLAPQYTYYSKAVKPYDSQTIIDENDAVFFATPAGVTSKLAKPFIDADFPVIDLSGDFRLKDPKEYEKWYHQPTAPQAELEQAYYGLADLTTNPGKNYVANPGCYATSVLLGLAPLMMNDSIDLDNIVIDAKSGLSGAGKKLSDSSHFVQANDNLQIYKPNEHKHIPEIMAMLKQWNPKVDHIQFMTTLVPFNRGIMSSIYVKVKDGVTEAMLKDQFAKVYKDHPFVKVADDSLPTVKEVVGTNECHIGLSYNPVTKYLLVDSVIDNMIKGAAGQAIQNFNLLFAYDADYGLKLTPVLP
ncbi:N-acetyl-gamma-glutamyl-phosphate reductase [Nicoliella spurrieriana]|uniref:N-acetyl-gamma-glutamyl-phosphate reductase n=1 Tax=Nicoliella spurrieriana TaxID=2925830 RepID=A0A976RT17_9LACO|nr:N-acetyl-gamma-glutamyl-phosphate reductase [Nicoliella spurrieriana]UQS87297.1 N-acetyl-gamma-glutamyl-phosphate reductase [Nicoliella spurrieriana]